MQAVKDVIDLVLTRLDELTSSEAVAGTPIEIGGLTLVPLTRVSMGFGGGGGDGAHGVHCHHHHGKGKGEKGTGTGAGAGGGVRIRPVGLAIFSAEGVEVVPIADRKGLIDRLFDKIPSVIDMVKQAHGD